MKNNFYMLRLIAEASPMRIFLQLLFCVLDSVSLFLSGSLILRYIMNALQSGSSSKDAIFYVAAIAAFISVKTICFQLYSKIYVPSSDITIRAKIQKMLFQKSQKTDLEGFENPDFYDSYIKAMQEAAARALSVINSLCLLLQSFISCLLNIGLVLYIDISFLPLMFLPLAYKIIFSRKENSTAFKMNMEIYTQLRKCNYVQRCFYLSDYAKEMRLTSIYKALLRDYSEASSKIIASFKRFGFTLASFDFAFSELYSVICTLGIYLFASYKALIAQSVLIGDYFVLINSASVIVSSVSMLIQGYAVIHSNSMYIENLRTFLSHKNPIEESIGKNSEVTAEFNQICFDNVSFKYSGSCSPALKNIDFTITKGEKIAIVGKNGAGKSTLVKLLLRLYDATDGQICADGKNIKDIPSYREHFSSFYQDFQTFALTLSDNITAGEAVKNENEILKAARLVGLDKELSKSVSKEFDDNGSILSGGEAQKLSLANIFIRKSDIIILDEPTSALDAEAEYDLYTNIFDKKKDNTIIFISHRLSFTARADRIIYLENGSISQIGTHDELMKIEGGYKRLFTMQADGYTGASNE